MDYKDLKRTDIVERLFSTVKYSNEFSKEPLKNFNSVDMNIFFTIISCFKDKGNEIIRFTFDYIRELSQYDKKSGTDSFIKDLKQVYSKLLQLSLIQEDEDYIEGTNLFSMFKIYKKDKFVDIKINKDFSGLFNTLEKFTQFQLLEHNQLKSSYSKRLYRILYQFASTGHIYQINVQEFKRLMDAPKSYKPGNIKQTILKPAMDELEPLFKDLTYIEHKKGKKVVGYSFHFKRMVFESRKLDELNLKDDKQIKGQIRADEITKDTL